MAHMRYLDLENHLNAVAFGSESAKPVYVIAGDDAYLRSSALSAFKGLLSEDYADFNFNVISEDDGSGAVMDALTTYPVFDDRKVVVVPDISEKLSDGDKELVKRYVLSPNPTSVLVAVIDDVLSDSDDDKQDGAKQNSKKQKGKKLSEQAKEFAKKFGLEYVDCNRLSEDEITAEINKLLAEPPACKMDGNAVRALIERTESYMTRIVREVQKLKSYAPSGITVKDVEDMVVPEENFAFFMLSSAVSEKQSDRALEIFDKFLKQGMKGVTIITMLYNQYRKMLLATLYKENDDAKLASLLEVSSGQLYHIKRVAKNYSQVRLKKCVDYLHEMQYAVQSGRRNDISAAHDVIITLLNS